MSEKIARKHLLCLVIGVRLIFKKKFFKNISSSFILHDFEQPPYAVHLPLLFSLCRVNSQLTWEESLVSSHR